VADNGSGAVDVAARMLGFPGFRVLAAVVALRRAACPVRTWSETSLAIGAKAASTERVRVWACRRVGATVAAVVRALGMGWGTVMAAVWAYRTASRSSMTRTASPG
jgi:hypothetical protein